LGDLVRALGAGSEPSPVKGDPAIDALGTAGLPLVAGVGGPVGVRRSARLGVGVLLTSLRAPEACADLIRMYRTAGGTRTVVLIRRVHVGTDAAGFGMSESAWQGRSDAPSWLHAADGALLTGSADQVAAKLVDAIRTSGADALNLRLDAYTGDDAQVPDQIARLAADVLPRIRAELGWATTEDA
jgi:alkanesulfonate monooxygenase SsuD/methylene tetrahydromethanopterin reductase-like flavin-dependent oxidoreductase (luciferase family)